MSDSLNGWSTATILTYKLVNDAITQHWSHPPPFSQTDGAGTTVHASYGPWFLGSGGQAGEMMIYIPITSLRIDIDSSVPGGPVSYTADIIDADPSQSGRGNLDRVALISCRVQARFTETSPGGVRHLKLVRGATGVRVNHSP